MIARSLVSVAAGFAVALGVAAGACAQDFPTRPVRVLIPIPAGGGPDLAARVLADKLQEVWQQPVVVENRPGSNGNVASEAVVNATPDGYTLTLCADTQIVVNPHLYTTMSFDPRKDLALVATVAVNQFFIVLNPKVPATTLPEFIEYARKANPPLAYGSGGNGSQHHLIMEILKQRAGVDLVHVPYRGGAPAIAAAMSGEVAVSVGGASAAPQIRGGVVRAIATTGLKRSPNFPDVPTVGEFYPGYVVETWLALFAPAKTPEPIINRMHEAVNKALALPDMKTKMTNTGPEPFITDRKEFETRIREEDQQYGALIKRIGLKLD